jgi:PucR C-terminal helix-turn-helix domain
MTRPHRRPVVPRTLAPVLRAELATLSDEVIAAVAHEVPLYALPLEGSFGRGVRVGVTAALWQFTDLVAAGGGGSPQDMTVYRDLGRGEFRQGRSLEALLAAYRVGARVAWRRFAAAATAHGIGSEQLAALAELVFDYIDGLSFASADGYAEEQSLTAGARERARRDLALLLLSGRADPPTVAAAATAALWRTPARVAAVVADAGAPLALRLGPDALVVDGAEVPGGDRAETIGLVPAAGVTTPTARLVRALSDIPAAIGPLVLPAGAADSLRRARHTRALVARGVLPSGGPVVADEHGITLLLHADPSLVDDLAADLLSPLSEENPASRARLEATLLAWLAHRGERAAAAAALHVHPQTVRYRMGRVRAAFGAALDDPDRRFALELVLRARQRPSTGSAPVIIRA